MNKELLDINKQTWNKRAEEHAKSEFYELDSFLQGASVLNPLDLELLGDIKGKKVLHLQCHFGMDTLSLARLGAEVTGVDFSDVAIKKAKELAEETGLKAEFICCDIVDLPNHLNGEFDIVFTSYGVITWLPDLHSWGKVIEHFLSASGHLLMIEFHPILWMFDEEYKTIKYPYSSKEIYRGYESSYTGEPGEKLEIINWMYGLADIVEALIGNSLKITSFREYDYSPYNLFNMYTADDDGKYRIKGKEKLFPLLFSLTATKDLCL